MAPRPKPTAILKLQGSRRANGRAHEPELPPATRDMEPPAILCGHALAEWHRLLPALVDAGVLTCVDRMCLAACCACYGRWVEAEQILREQGHVITTTNGNPQINPALSIANESLRQYRAFAIELGLTPSSRSRVRADKPAKGDGGFEQYLNTKT